MYMYYNLQSWWIPLSGLLTVSKIECEIAVSLSLTTGFFRWLITKLQSFLYFLHKLKI